MKVKEIDRTANIAWSPSAHHPIYLAAGTAAQQLDATFSTSAALEIYDLNLSEPGLDMCLKGSIVCDYRFHKVVWGSNGMKGEGGMKADKPSGILVGGADGGNILMYDPAKLLAGEDALLYHKTQHSGPVNSLDFNKFQDCLLASGSCDSEIFIWDLNNPASPMTPGTKSLPTEDVTSVAWNCQVQHILASTFTARCVVWDLRKNEPIIKVSDSSSKMKCKIVAWHPEVATQLCLASDDDHSPLIQLWDLRFATTPVRNLEKHQRGVLAVAWCPQDPDLLLSCSKDNHILCWNPNSTAEGGEVICELPTSDQWCFDIAWCPRNPAVIASSSCDGRVSVHSLMGGQSQTQCSSKIAESFPGSDLLPPQISSQNQKQTTVYLKKPPKWLRRQAGASFSFGGKLISTSGSNAQQPNDQRSLVKVYISQVVTEPSILNKALELEAALTSRKLAEFCHTKAEISKTRQEKIEWYFLEATFAPSPRAKMLSLLGYDYQNSPSFSTAKDSQISSLPEDLTAKMANMSPSTSHLGDRGDYDPISDSIRKVDDTFTIHTDGGDSAAVLNRALLTGNIELAVDLCLSDNRWADALVLAQAGGYDLLQKTQKQYFKSVVNSSSKLIAAVATSDWTSVIENCDISSWKEGLAAILTYAKPEEFAQLCEVLGKRLEKEKDGALKENASLCYISSGNLESFVELWKKTHRSSNDTELESLVEQVMVLRQAVEQLSGSTTLQSSMVSAVLAEFADVLASQGHLKSALLYLGDSNEKSPELAVLKDRICKSLSLQSPYFPFQRVDVHKDHSIVGEQERRRSSVYSSRASQSSSIREPIQSSFYQPQQQQQQQSQQFQSYAPNVLQPAPPAPTVSYAQTHFNAPPAQTPYVPPSAQHMPPPPPPSAGSMQLSSQVPADVPPPPPADTPNIYGGKSGSGHLSHRYPKHLHDPSVYSENTYSSQQQYYPVQSFAAPSPEMSFVQQKAPSQPTSYYSTEQSMTAAFPMGSSMPSYPSTPYSQPQAPPAMPSESLPPTHPSAMPQPSSFSAIKSGWNDPPMLKHATAMSSHTYQQPQSAITAPLPGVPGPEIMQPAAVPPPNNYFNPSYAAEPQPAQMSHVKEPPTSGMNPTLLPEIPKEKAPIPAEHKVIKETLDDLRQRCLLAASSPLACRKLDDVAKKLEILYDKLRERSLSSHVENGLHQIIQAITQGDYSAAIAAQGMLVSSSNFSEICGFMPSVKMLLQTAAQHGVYLN